jgi:hypothetical protein
LPSTRNSASPCHDCLRGAEAAGEELTNSNLDLTCCFVAADSTS